MHSLLFLIRKLFALVLVKPFLKVKVLPQQLGLDESNTCLFILPKHYSADALALEQALKQQGLKNNYSILFLPKESKGNQWNDFSSALHRKNTAIIPVSIFWGRSPRKTKSIWQTWLSNSWSIPGMIKRRIIILLQSRQVHCYFSQSLPTNNDLLNNPSQLHQSLSEKFIKQKETVIGPDLSHRRILAEQVIQSDAVSQCIEGLANGDNKQREKLNHKAHKYINEMASDYSYSVVRLLDIFLTWVWEKLYQGIEIKGMENISAIAEEYELVYVPCHRSHIDYLLLSYAIYHKGLMPPHIAAGINLNLPVVGSILRRGGAFFIRRQFKDNLLYKAVLESYLKTMCQQGFAMEYFIEGGRSRTGLLLPPKPGMLAMTLRATTEQQQKPLAFIPVYIGYERILESHSYISELYGEQKQKETLSGVFSALGFLKEDYGKAFLSIGKPITLKDLEIDTAASEADNKELFFQSINTLGQHIQTAVNLSAYVSASNLISTALLGSKRNALLESQLNIQVDLLLQLLTLDKLRETIHIESFELNNALNHNLDLDIIKRNQHALGDIYYLDQKAEVNATFLRNNTLHLFILPALISCILVNSNKISLKRIIDICLMLYPYLKSEFFLPFLNEEIESVTLHTLDTFLNKELITFNNGFYRVFGSETEQFHTLTVLSGACKGSIERFYIVAQLVSSVENGFYTRKTLEEACIQMAQRLSLLHEFHAPDFFDKNLFRMFFDSLIKENIFTEDNKEKLFYSKAFLTAKKFDRYVLSPSVKRSIKQCYQYKT